MAQRSPSLITLPGDPPLAVTLRRSARARRLSLRVSQLDGRVTLTLPSRAPLREGLAFLEEKSDWIRHHLQARPDHVKVTLGADLPIEGQIFRLAPATGRQVRIEGGYLLVPGAEAQAGFRARSFLKALARDRLAAASDRYAARIGRGFGKLTLRDTRSRWGSCSSEGNLMYSWRLIMAPPQVLDYVAAHEVAHLAQMDHSPAYWAGLARLCPDYKAHKGWLAANGSSLHRYRFDD